LFGIGAVEFMILLVPVAWSWVSSSGVFTLR